MYGKQTTQGNSPGFTLIELLVVVAIVAVLLSFALPTYREYTVRANVTEGLQLSQGMQTAVSNYCEALPEGNFHSRVDLGRLAPVDNQHVQWLDAASFGQDCSLPVIGFQTVNTGAAVEPIIFLVGMMLDGKMAWGCYLVTGEPRQVPDACQQPIALSPLAASFPPPEARS